MNTRHHHASPGDYCFEDFRCKQLERRCERRIRFVREKFTVYNSTSMKNHTSHGAFEKMVAASAKARIEKTAVNYTDR